MIALAWPFVALCALAVVAWFAHRAAPALDWKRSIELEVRNARHTQEGLVTGQRLLKQDTQGRLTEDILDLRKQLDELRKRLETAELRKLGGGR